MKKIIAFVLFFATCCTVQAQKTSDKKTLKPDEFVSKVRDKAALSGMFTYLLGRGMYEMFGAAEKKFEQDPSAYGTAGQVFSAIGKHTSYIPFYAYAHSCLAHEFCSALLEKDSSFLLRLFRHASISLAPDFSLQDDQDMRRVGKNACIDFSLGAMEEVLRLGLYKGAEHFLQGDDKRKKRRVVRVLGKSLIAGLLSYAGYNWKGLKQQQWGALVQFFSRLIFYSYCEFMAECFLEKNGVKRFIERCKIDENIDLLDVFSFTEDGTAATKVMAGTGATVGIVASGAQVARGEDVPVNLVRLLYFTWRLLEILS